LLVVVVIVSSSSSNSGISIDNSNSDIVINVKSDECLAIISRDGHQKTCQGYDNSFSISSTSISRYDKVAIVVYNNRTGIFSDAKVINVKELSHSNTLKSSKLTILWPRYTTVTSSTIDIHYYANTNTNTNKICSRVSNLIKNNVNSDSSITTVNNDDLIKCYDPSHIITIDNFLDSEYCVHLYDYTSDNTNDDVVR
jgi:hypothetical protein